MKGDASGFSTQMVLKYLYNEKYGTDIKSEDYKEVNSETQVASTEEKQVEKQVGKHEETPEKPGKEERNNN